MKLDSKECKEALNNYKVTNDIEKMAIKVLIVKEEDVVKIPGLLNMSDEQMHELARVIREIRSNIGIKD